ncbi:MAG: hypothetical protein KDC95_03525, partial [Planctomycetes bacterium]|nr:hypothetical protein [Planctomycetota bacterium]
MAKQKQAARRVRTLKAVAEHFGVAAPTAGAWRRKPGFPVHATSDGKAEYDLDEITLWLQRRPKQFLQARQGAPLGGSLRGPREGSPAELEHRGSGGPSDPAGSNST